MKRDVQNAEAFHSRGPRRGRLISCVVGLAVLAVGLPARAASAQTPPVKDIEVHGRVIDKASGKPIAGVLVARSGHARGVFTNRRGRFTLSHVRPGKLSLTAEQMGYKAIQWDGVVEPGQDTLTMPLPPRPRLLHGLRVEAARLQFRRRSTGASVEVFHQRELASSTRDNVLDFLNARAGLTGIACPYWSGSEQCYWIDGQVVEPTVYIDEVRVPEGASELQTMAPQDLYMIEVYGRGAEIRVYTKPFIRQAARTDLQLMPIGF